MPIARCNDIDICYATQGDPSGKPLIMIMGLRNQLIRWPAPLCAKLVDRGHYLVLFDNRDAGRSTTLHDAGVPDLAAVAQARAGGQRPDVPYTLSDMARDTVLLMDALELPAAHVLGVSLGGMIAQTMAIEHPGRVLTLTSVMSTTGRPGLPGPSPAGAPVLSWRAPAERAAFIEHSVELDRFLNGPHMPFDEAASRRCAALTFDRGYSPAASARQLAAVMASGSRHARLATLAVNALVVHGDADELVPVAAGRDTAGCVPGARYIEVAGLGHSLPRPIWDKLADEVATLTDNA